MDLSTLSRSPLTGYEVSLAKKEKRRNSINGSKMRITEMDDRAPVPWALHVKIGRQGTQLARHLLSIF